MKKKGFTLIELLAVIVVLAVVALISMPLVLNTIDKARMGAFKATANNVKDSAEYYQEKGLMNGTLRECEYFSFDKNVEEKTTIDGKVYVPIKELYMKGNLPTTGEIKVCSNEIIMDVGDGTYRGIYENNNYIVAKKDDIESSDNTIPTVKLSYTSTLNEIKVNVDAKAGKYGAIKEYYYKIDDSEYIKEENPIYTFTNLTPEKEYKIKVYVVSKANKKSEEIEISAHTTNFGTCNITVTDDGRWTTSKTVLIEGNDKNSILQYKINVGSNPSNNIDWTNYVDRLTLNDNASINTPTTIYCRYIDNNLNTSSASQKTITKIDNTTPKVELTGNIISGKITNKNVVLEAKGTGSISTYSYEWYKYSEGGYNKIENTSNIYEINKTDISTYAVRVKNEAGTYSEYSNLYEVKVDKESPTIDAPTVEKELSNDSYVFKITSNQKDIVTGIGKVTYLISEDGKSYSEEENNIINNLLPGKIYYVKTKAIDKAGNESLSKEIKIELNKLEGKIELSSTNDSYTYPDSKEIEIVSNKSGGVLSCSSNDDSIATCKIIDNKLVVAPGVKQGSATITIISSETNIYKEAKVAYVAITSHGLLSYTASGYNKAYDGSNHSITVTSSGATIAYSSDGTNYSSTKPTYRDVGTYTVYYKIEKEGYKTITGTEKVTIIKANGSVIAPTVKNLTYNGSAQALVNAGSTNTGTIQYKLNNGTYSNSIPTATNAGTYTVYYKVIGDANHNDVSEKYVTVTINKANGSVIAPTVKTLTYNGSAQALVNAGSTNTGTIQYKLNNGTYSNSIPTATNAGTYTVYYKVIGDANHNDVIEQSVIMTIKRLAASSVTYSNKTYTGSEQVAVTGSNVTLTGTLKATSVGNYIAYAEPTNNYTWSDGTTSKKTINWSIVKANNTLKLSSNSGSYTYPNSGTFSVTTNVSGGDLSCSSNNSSVATCKISGTTVTVIPGTTKGSATITVTSKETANYNSGSAAYVAITSHGLLSYTASGYNKAYDGSNHSITVTSSGATITYSSDGTNYSSTKLTYRDVGTYTVYYKIEKEGYKTITGTEKVTIIKANGSVIAPTVKNLTYNGSAQALVNAGSTNTGTIQYKLNNGTYSNSIPTATNAGTYTVYYKVIGDANHNDVSEKSVTVTINKATGSVIAPTVKTLTYNGSTQALVNAGSTNTGTIQYKLNNRTYSNSIPTATNVGTYTVYYKVIGDANHNDVTEKAITATINKANNTLKLSSNSGSYTYPNSGTFSVTTNVSGGDLSCSSNNSSVATCKISGTTVTVIPGTTKGSATITVTSKETANYNSSSVAHVVTTNLGTLSVTASGYNGTYNGSDHSITVTSSGATITYSSDGTNYSSTKPTYRNAGTYTTYYKVSKTGYNTVTGSRTVVINKASGSISLSSTSGKVSVGSSITVKVNSTTGTLGCSSSNTSIATCSVSGDTITISGKNLGSTTITISVAASTNYNAASVTYNVTVNKNYQVYSNGTAVYYNPETNKKCSSSEAVSTTGTKTGCMKWYTFNDNGSSSSTVYMLLDHNISSPTSYSNNVASGSDDDTKIKTDIKNYTATWNKNINPRLISAYEISKIVGYTSFNGTQMFDITGYKWLYEGFDDIDRAYWTSTPRNAEDVWIVYGTGTLFGRDATDSEYTGIRPVITVSKDIIN